MLGCASHGTVLPGHAYGSLDWCVSLTAGAALTPGCCPPGDGSCRGSALRYVRQEGAHAGYVRCARLPAPLRAVGEREAQLTVTRSSQSISPFAPPAFTGFDATTRRSDFCMGIGQSSLPPSSLPLEDASNRGPTQTSQGKDTEFTAAPVPNTAPTSVGFWASRSKARSPGRPGLLRASLAFGAAARLRLLPHTASRPCSCLRLVVATNSLHRGLAPPIQGPCLAHLRRQAAPRNDV